MTAYDRLIAAMRNAIDALLDVAEAAAALSRVSMADTLGTLDARDRLAAALDRIEP